MEFNHNFTELSTLGIKAIERSKASETMVKLIMVIFNIVHVDSE